MGGRGTWEEGKGLANVSGEQPEAQGRGCGRCATGREEKRGEAWIGTGPGGGSHADKHRDKLISSVYPGAGASSPATSSLSLPWLRSRVWDVEEEHGKRGLFPMALSASDSLSVSPGLREHL